MRPVDLLSQALSGTDELVAVTGATGWFGAVALDLLYEALGDQAPARVMAYASSESEVAVSDGRAVMVRALVDIVGQDPSPTTLLHCAFVTGDKVARLGVDRYTCQNIAITASVLGAIARHKPRQVVAMSSGAVHSPMGGLVSDLLAEPYGTLKHLDELAFRAATQDAGGTCVIPRVFSVAGARMPKPELYALSSMLGMAAVGGPIEVQARGPVYRSYCGVDEVVALSLWAALSGRDVVFDTCGTVVELGDLARMVAHEHGLGAGVIRRTWDPDVVAESYVGDGRIMEALASEAGLSLGSLPALIRAASVGLSVGRAHGRGVE